MFISNGKIFICDGCRYLCEGEKYWENNLKMLSRRKRGPEGKGGLRAKPPENCCRPHLSDYWKAYKTLSQHIHLGQASWRRESLAFHRLPQFYIDLLLDEQLFCRS